MHTAEKEISRKYKNCLKEKKKKKMQETAHGPP